MKKRMKLMKRVTSELADLRIVKYQIPQYTPASKRPANTGTQRPNREISQAIS